MPFAARALPFSFLPLRRKSGQMPLHSSLPSGVRSKFGRNPLKLLVSRTHPSRRSRMPNPKPEQTIHTAADPQVTLDPQEARQGRSGTRTLLVLTVSLILAAVAGVALGVIPIGVF
jgi:hypothetical protein